MGVRFGLISDSHLAPPGTPDSAWHNAYRLQEAEELLEAGLDALARERVDAVLVLGDLTHLGDAASLARGLALLRERTSCPVLVVPGNHDVLERPDPFAALPDDGGRVRLATVAGERIAAGGPRVAGLPLGGHPEEAADGRRALPAVEDWAADEAVLWIAHHPLLDCEQRIRAAGLLWAGALPDESRRRGLLLARRGPTVALTGHLHVRDHRAEGPVLELGLAALVEAPYEVGVLDVETGRDGALRIEVERLPLRDAAGLGLPVLAPPRAAWAFEAGRGWHPLGGERPLERVPPPAA